MSSVNQANSGSSAPRIGLALLAAGTASRFGSNKLLEPFGSGPLYERVLNAVPKDVLDRVVVVTAYEELARAAEERGFFIRWNSNPELGQGFSIRLAVEEMDGLDACIFCVCDQPYLSSASIVRLVEAYRTRDTQTPDQQPAPPPIIALTFCEQRGNPVLFSSEYFPELALLDNHQTGSAIMRAHPEAVLFIEADCSCELADMDSLKDRAELAKVKNFFLTGEPGIGKSTILRRTMVEYDLAPTGFLTLPYAIERHHAGHYIHALSDLIALDDNDKPISVYTGRRTCVSVPDVFEILGVRYLLAAEQDSRDSVMMDELGRLEQDAPTFQQHVLRLLDGPKTVIGVLKDSREASWLDEIRARTDTRVVRVLAETRSHAERELRDFLDTCFAVRDGYD